jgi:hypothetical protein
MCNEIWNLLETIDAIFGFLKYSHNPEQRIQRKYIIKNNLSHKKALPTKYLSWNDGFPFLLILISKKPGTLKDPPNISCSKCTYLKS